MTTIRAILISTLLAASLGLPTQCSAQGEGGIPIRVSVPDDPSVPSRCINPSKDEVWLTLRRVVTTRSKGLFTSDSDLSVVVNVHVQTDPPPSTPITYPLVALAQFGNTPTGQVSIPIEYTIVNGLVLKQNEKTAAGNVQVTYTGLGVDVTLLNTKKINALGTAIKTLADITSSGKLPIPTSPYASAATYLLGYANTAIENSIKAANAGDKAVTGSLAFIFDPAGQCRSVAANGSDFEKTGTKAFLSSDGDKTPNPGTGVYVDINQTNNYCWRADLTPGFVLKAAAIRSGVACNSSSYTFLPVTNNYTAFFLNKQQVPTTLGPLRGIALRDRQESIKRCRANGITDPNSCPGGH